MVLPSDLLALGIHCSGSLAELVAERLVVTFDPEVLHGLLPSDLLAFCAALLRMTGQACFVVRDVFSAPTWVFVLRSVISF
jgi:hypothetical protein